MGGKAEWVTETSGIGLWWGLHNSVNLVKSLMTLMLGVIFMAYKLCHNKTLKKDEASSSNFILLLFSLEDMRELLVKSCILWASLLKVSSLHEMTLPLSSGLPSAWVRESMPYSPTCGSHAREWCIWEQRWVVRVCSQRADVLWESHSRCPLEST